MKMEISADTVILSPLLLNSWKRVIYKGDMLCGYFDDDSSDFF